MPSFKNIVTDKFLEITRDMNAATTEQQQHRIIQQIKFYDSCVKVLKIPEQSHNNLIKIAIHNNHTVILGFLLDNETKKDYQDYFSYAKNADVSTLDFLWKYSGFNTNTYSKYVVREIAHGMFKDEKHKHLQYITEKMIAPGDTEKIHELLVLAAFFKDIPMMDYLVSAGAKLKYARHDIAKSAIAMGKITVLDFCYEHGYSLENIKALSRQCDFVSSETHSWLMYHELQLELPSSKHTKRQLKI